MQSFDLTRRLASEALGTAMLVAAVVGSGIMADRLTDDTALALLANTLATGAILVVLISLLGPISGAHFNPAISLVMAASGALGRRDLAAYVGAQLFGGMLGTMAAHLMFELPLLAQSTTGRAGGAQWFSEGIATFGLAFVTLTGTRLRLNSVAWLVGLYIVSAYWFTASTSFANPAVAVARSLTDSFAGIRPIDLPGFVLAELAGALVALGLCAWLLKTESRSA